MNLLKAFTYLLPIFCVGLGLFTVTHTVQYVRMAFHAPRNGKGRDPHVA